MVNKPPTSKQINTQTIHLSTFICKCIYNHRTTKTNQKYPSVNL